jgi:integrase
MVCGEFQVTELGPMPRLNKRFVDSKLSSPPAKDVTYWDDTLKGFGLRMQPGGAASWIVMYRTQEARLRKLMIGKLGRLTPDEARSEAKLKLAEVEKGIDPASDKSDARKAMTVAELCDLYLAEAEGRIKPSTLAMDKSRIECHVKPLLGRNSVRGLTVEDIERFQISVASGKTAKPRKEKGRTGNTTGGKGVAARTVGMLGTILEVARRRKIITENPARSVRKFEGGKKKRFLSEVELKALGEAMRQAEHEGENKTGIAAIKALLLTGCRRNEILALPWAWLDVEASCLRFGDTKSGAQLRPIGAAAAQLLQSQPHREGCEWVFPADRGDGHFVGLPRVLERLCARAGLKDVTLHTLRHTFASVAAMLGFSELTIAGMIGHSVPGVTARYSHLPDSALISAAYRVAGHIVARLEGVEEGDNVHFIQRVL